MNDSSILKARANPRRLFTAAMMLAIILRPPQTTAITDRHVNYRDASFSQQQKSSTPRDHDNDGIDDHRERTLAEKYAPIVFHDPGEPNLQTSVELFLPHTQLWFYDANCKPRGVKITDAIHSQIPRHHQAPCAASDTEADSHGTRSRAKERSFFLDNVAPEHRIGSLNPSNWSTYFHSYPNDVGGITIQYWRFYAYNTGYVLGFRISLGSHGGDWEAVHIVLDANFRPVRAAFLGHRDISSKPWADLPTEGDHLLVESGKGGHTTKPFRKRARPERLIRQECWSGGRVTWPEAAFSRLGKSGSAAGGPLLNLGEKAAPMPEMGFLRYSGLWGARKAGGLMPRLRSGYWGPAFNETGMGPEDFISAWCDGMLRTLRERIVTIDNEQIRECYPTNANR